MKKCSLCLPILCAMYIVGCSEKTNQEEIISQLNDQKGTVVSITESQVDCVNEIIDSYYSDAVYPFGYKTTNYTVTNIKDTYRIKGVFSTNINNEYIMIITQNDNNEPYTLNSFYVNGEKIDSSR